MASIFPYLLGSNTPPSPGDVKALYQTVYEKGLQERTLRPLVLPYHLYGIFLLIFYMCIPHVQRPWLYQARWAVLAVIWWWQLRVLYQATSPSAATGYAAGLISAWGMVLSATWLVWCRPQFDARRVARRRKGIYQNGLAMEGKEVTAQEINGEQHAEAENGYVYEHLNGNEAVKHRPSANGHSKSPQNHIATTTKGHVNGRALATARKTENPTPEWEYYWQSYPSTLRERIPWVTDLIINFRGPGWTWAIAPLPPLPPSIQTALSERVNEASITGISSVGLRRYNSRREMIQVLIPRYIAGYLALDILKVILNKDPYFTFGPNTYTLPPHLSPLPPFLLQLLRLTLNAAVIILALEMVFMMAPIGFSLILGPSVLGPQGEPWMYSTTWGSLKNVTHKGLNGLWGGWWHQVFRFGFAAPTNYFIKNGYLKARSSKAKLSALVFAFGTSGLLHWGGSTSTIPRTYTWQPPVFFAFQALGILIQTLFCALLSPQIKRLPSIIRHLGNLLFALSWLFYTGHFLLDDFARGGMWLWEPIPISPLRGMGFGNEGDGWWCWPRCKDGGWLCWEMLGVGWYRGEHWWESGVAI